MLMQIVYSSDACKPMTSRELETLVDQAKVNNSEFNITGLLVYCNGHFLQLLEGEEEHVRLILNTIKQDPRHKNLEVIVSNHSQARVAESWNMVLYEPDKEQLSASEKQFFLSAKEKQRASLNADLVWRIVHRYVDLLSKHSPDYDA